MSIASQTDIDTTSWIYHLHCNACRDLLVILGLLANSVTLGHLVQLDPLAVKALLENLVAMEKMESLVIVECKGDRVPLDLQDGLE